MKITSKQEILATLGSVMTVLMLQGCATNAVNQRLDDKVASEPAVEHKRDLRARTAKDIETASNLTGDQKMELRAVREWINSQTDELDLQSLKLRSVLVKDIVSRDYDSGEVDLIKSRLKSLENKRLTVMFEAVRRVDAAMGHPDPSRRMAEDFVVYPAMLIYPWSD